MSAKQAERGKSSIFIFQNDYVNSRVPISRSLVDGIRRHQYEALIFILKTTYSKPIFRF